MKSWKQAVNNMSGGSNITVSRTMQIEGTRQQAHKMLVLVVGEDYPLNLTSNYTSFLIANDEMCNYDSLRKWLGTLVSEDSKDEQIERLTKQLEIAKLKQEKAKEEGVTDFEKKMLFLKAETDAEKELLMYKHKISLREKGWAKDEIDLVNK